LNEFFAASYPGTPWLPGQRDTVSHSQGWREPMEQPSLAACACDISRVSYEETANIIYMIITEIFGESLSFQIWLPEPSTVFSAYVNLELFMARIVCKDLVKDFTLITLYLWQIPFICWETRDKTGFAIYTCKWMHFWITYDNINSILFKVMLRKIGFIY
jgi:hypothetical protein